MIKNIKQRMHKDQEEGFTLIELLVVVLIIGILMAIAIPTFLSLTSGAKTNAAEADLTTASQDEATYYTSNGSYDATGAATPTAADNIQAGTTNGTNANLPGMKGLDPGINWLSSLPASTTGGTKTVGVNLISANEVVLSTVGQSGKYYYVDDVSGKLQYDIGTATTTMPTAGSTPTPVTWGTSWSGATTI